MAEYVYGFVPFEEIPEFKMVRREEVVRCRDCRYCMSYWKSDYCDYFSHVTNDPDGFCAWGERKVVDE